MASSDFGKEAHFQASATALDQVTNAAVESKAENPKNTLHVPANHEKSHKWLQRIFPYQSLEEMESAWGLGNYVIDRTTRQKTWEPMSIYVRIGMHLLYVGSEQEKALHSQRVQKLWKEQSDKMGREYDDPKSVDHIVPFIESFDLQDSLKELKEPDPTKYKTFNDFFSRELRPDARPIAEPENDRVVSSVADCRLTAFPTIDLATKYWIKGFGFTLARLLNSEQLANYFDGGSIVIQRLAPQDYHRWHSPVDGTVESIEQIHGTYYTVNPMAVREPGTMDVYCENSRSVMIMKRKATGSPIAVIAVGAMLVGSIVYNDGIKEGADIKRGECLGAFRYGGSTVLTILPKGEAIVDEDIVRHSTQDACETLMKVGWRVGAGPA